MLDDLRRFAADVHTISADFHRWAGQLWWLAALSLLVGLLNMALLGYLIWTVRRRLNAIPAVQVPLFTVTADR
jgi:hypothetical protein